MNPEQHEEFQRWISQPNIETYGVSTSKHVRIAYDAWRAAKEHAATTLPKIVTTALQIERQRILSLVEDYCKDQINLLKPIEQGTAARGESERHFFTKGQIKVFQEIADELRHLTNPQFPLVFSGPNPGEVLLNSQYVSRKDLDELKDRLVEMKLPDNPSNAGWELIGQFVLDKVDVSSQGRTMHVPGLTNPPEPPHHAACPKPEEPHDACQIEAGLHWRYP